jgi:hypothetical protein
MNRRMVVESANAALKGGFVNLNRGFVRVFGVTKINLLLGFTIAAYNLDRVAHSPQAPLGNLAEIARSGRGRARGRRASWLKKSSTE